MLLQGVAGVGTKKIKAAVRFEVLEILPPVAAVVPLSSARAKMPFFRIKHSSTDQEASIVYPAVTENGVPWELNISALMPAPNLCRPLAEAIIQAYGPTPNRKTLRGIIGALTSGMIAFLVDTERCYIDLSGINKGLLETFMDWLDHKAIWAESARPKLYRNFAGLLRRLKTIEPWRNSFGPDFHIPSGHWVGADRRRNPVNVIDQDLMTRIRRACISEVTEIMSLFNETMEICASSRENLVPLDSLPPMKKGPKRPGEKGGWSMDLFIAYADQTSKGGAVLTATQIAQQYSNGAALARAMVRRNVSMARDIAPRFHATSRTIVPFVLLMTIALAYNPDTIRNSKVDDYYYDHELGEFFIANAYKGRSGARQPVYIPIDDNTDNPSVLFQFLLQWTARLRASIDAQLRSHLFVFASADDLTVSAFYSGDSQIWKRQLENFRSTHDLEYFTLEMIRKTVLDLAYDIFGGDIKAVQIQASHRSAETTNIYSSAGEQQRRYQKLGRVMEQRQRHRETNGLIDPRDRSKSEDLSCATPGWQCGDPYDSPFSEKGKLCVKYGWCPVCPLGLIDLSVPLTFAYAIGLLDAVNRAQSAMSPETWLQRLGPIKRKLEEYWLPLFNPDIVEAARTIQIPILPMPE